MADSISSERHIHNHMLIADQSPLWEPRSVLVSSPRRRPRSLQETNRQYCTVCICTVLRMRYLSVLLCDIIGARSKIPNPEAVIISRWTKQGLRGHAFLWSYKVAVWLLTRSYSLVLTRTRPSFQADKDTNPTPSK